MSELPLYTPPVDNVPLQDNKNRLIPTNDEEFMSVYLPSRVFNSKFRFFWYHYWDSGINKLISVCFIVFFVTCFIVSPRASVILPTVLLSSFMVAIISLTFSNTFGVHERLHKLDFNAKRAFLTEVINEAPDYRIKRWHIIAARMNKFLKDEEISPNYYTLYDGKDCLDVYNYLISSLKPSSFKIAIQQLFRSSNTITNSGASSSARNVDEITSDILKDLAMRAQNVIRASIENVEV
ncbi:similar to Saccharomyces cerevisiae YHL044W Putative integral membrane protein, member of DUP240 gene family [Maudiozyma saulgeensis]|uniref:Similar to Saccharomyces cerevisiae YHL044W Putative integral membrane protein, member of DUP240 gene family n=1 Tax=Maudiozyma saulgeensis TaxID=1789683 RepID=A0A1X7R8T0_9SACH|nr:similar to Saccharomyces cerevisiae YHL044W Putative integral membrane protein, member of DUP240 gene family [Kazachstania saulgeensis]